MGLLHHYDNLNHFYKKKKINKIKQKNNIYEVIV